MLTTYEGIVKQGHIHLPVGTPAPEGVRVLVTFLPRLDERSARRKANSWLGDSVGDRVMAGGGRMERVGEMPGMALLAMTRARAEQLRKAAQCCRGRNANAARNTNAIPPIKRPDRALMISDCGL